MHLSGHVCAVPYFIGSAYKLAILMVGYELVMLEYKLVMLGLKLVMLGHKLVMLGPMPTQAHPWLLQCT